MNRLAYVWLTSCCALLAGCTSDPNAPVNQLWPIPQMDAAFGAPHTRLSARQPVDSQRPGYLPAYPPYQPDETALSDAGGTGQATRTAQDGGAPDQPDTRGASPFTQEATGGAGLAASQGARENGIPYPDRRGGVFYGQEAGNPASLNQGIGGPGAPYGQGPADQDAAEPASPYPPGPRVDALPYQQGPGEAVLPRQPGYDVPASPYQQGMGEPEPADERTPGSENPSPPYNPRTLGAAGGGSNYVR